LDGWGDLSVSNLKYSIEKSKTVSLEKFIYSIGIRHIGAENAKLISDYVRSTKNFIELVDKKHFDQFLNIDGIGVTQIKSIKKFFENKTNYDIFIKLSKILTIQKRAINKKGKLRDKNFMFTGKLRNLSRAEAKSLVEQNSGSIVSTVSKRLNFLVIGEKPTNKKIEQAKQLGIKILSQDEWYKLLN
jgi:DNA ligase (NAD+)